MSRLFDINNGFFSFMGKVYDCCILSLLWLVCCIPIITIGPATTALYYAIVKVVRRERGYITREFFRSFKLNFKIGTISWIIILILFLVLSGNIYFAMNIKGKVGQLLLYLYIAMYFFLYITMLYIFPVLSRFTLGIKKLFKTSILLACRHLLTTIVVGVLVIAAFFGVYYTYLLGIVIFPAACAVLSSFMMERVLKKYTPPVEGDTSTDQWYLE